ncbi:MAG: hypothetical protein ACOC9T_00535 [Myxococcota bacterium]
MSEEQGEKVAAEVAEAEFQRFLDAMDLDHDEEGMDEEDLKSFQKEKARVVKAIQDGRMSIDEKGQPTFQPTDGEPITFREPRGSTLMAMDSKKKNHDVTKLFATMAEMTKVPVQKFSKMPNRDLKVCLAVTLLFLG